MGLKTDRSKPLKYLLLLILLFRLIIPAAHAAKADNTLVFGFLPILSTHKLISRFKPLVDYLSRTLGQPIRMETARNYVEFLKRTRKQRYDILFTAPHFYYLANKENGYQVIVRVGAPELKAILVATRASHITRLAQLKGKKIATPDSLSLGTALIRNLLRSAGLDPDVDVTLIATPSHNASLLTAFNGTTEAAGLMIPPYQRTAENIRNEMVTLGITKGVPHMPIAVSPSLSQDKIDKIVKSLLSLHETKEGQALLKHLSWPMGFARASNAEYASLKAIAQDIKF